MPTYTDPFTGAPIIGDAPPALGTGTYARNPKGWLEKAAYERNPSWFSTTVGPNAPVPSGYAESDFTPSGSRGYDEIPLPGGIGWFRSTGPGTLQKPKTFYTDGDEWRVIQRADDLEGLQAALDAAGLMPDDYFLGQPDSATAKAVRALMEIANASGLTWEEVLRDRAGKGSMAGGEERAPLRVVLTNPDDIRAVLQAGMQQVYGKYMDEGDVQKFIASYHQQEAAMQTAAYNMAESGGTQTAAPASSGGINEAFRRQFVEDNFDEAGAAVFTSNLDLFLDSLRGGPAR